MRMNRRNRWYGRNWKFRCKFPSQVVEGYGNCRWLRYPRIMYHQYGTLMGTSERWWSEFRSGVVARRAGTVLW